ncbi:MAG: hypothetical protein U1E29_03755 [Coriobacteriia bacterium]|nr:hypothetical protein [Coriobacteriia bacterium]
MPEEERVEHLSALVNVAAVSNTRRTERVMFRGQPLDAPVISVEAGFPRYRLQNGRTRRKQEAYLENNPDAARDIFGDPTSEDAQAAQHAILVEMAADADLRALIERDGQQHPLILTHDGYVVNGNRRLAVIRDLGRDDWVDAVVLPPSRAADLAILEMNLQMAEDGKADYNWVDELLTIESNIAELDLSVEQVARAMHVQMRTIELKRETLVLVNLYLEAIHKHSQHFLIEGDEQAFDTLARAHREYNDNPSMQASIRSMGFNIIARPRAGRSTHLQLQKMVRGLEKSVELLGVLDPPDDVPAPGTDTALLFDPNDLDAAEQYVVNMPVSEESADRIHEAIEVANGLEGEEEEARAALKSVKEAARALAGVEIRETTTERRAIRGQLDSIDRECARIRGHLQVTGE